MSLPPGGDDADAAVALAQVALRTTELEQRVEDLAQQLQAIVAQQQPPPAASEAPAVEVTQHGPLLEAQAPTAQAAITEELDRRSEARQASMWKELCGHTKAEVEWVEKLEVNLSARLEKLETSFNSFFDEAGRSKEKHNEVHGVADQLQRDQAKELEGLKWRLSFLEWSTKGESQSFGRPLDAKALPLSPPGHASGPLPTTEDAELWAREASGRQRMRRPLQVTKVAPTSPITSPGTLPRGRSTSEQSAGARGLTRSTGRLLALP